MTIRKVLAFVLLALLAAFVLFNLDPARVWFFVGRVEMPIGLVVLISAALGAAVTALLILFRRHRAD